jgi:hypothetical protein
MASTPQGTGPAPKPKKTFNDAIASLKGWPLVVVVALRLAFGAFVVWQLCNTVIRLKEIEHKPPWLELITYLASPGILLVGLTLWARWKEKKLAVEMDIGIVELLAKRFGGSSQ